MFIAERRTRESACECGDHAGQPDDQRDSNRATHRPFQLRHNTPSAGAAPSKVVLLPVKYLQLDASFKDETVLMTPADPVAVLAQGSGSDLAFGSLMMRAILFASLSTTRLAATFSPDTEVQLLTPKVTASKTRVE